MIIVSITGSTMQEALAQVACSSPYADMFEFRLDLMMKPNIARLLASTKKPTISTCRPEREGGGFGGTERERIGLLELASVYGAQYVDIELNSSPSVIADFVRHRKESKVIASCHLLDGTLFEVGRVYEALRATGADIIKLAYQGEDAFENHLAFEFLGKAKSDRQQAVAMMLGDAGEPSRVLYKKYGGWATYASTEDGKVATPGQIPASLLKTVYCADKLTAATRVFGVVGNPVRQSKGIFLHNPLFRRARKNAVYCRFQTSDIDKFVRFLVPHLSGFSITLPHKQSVMSYLDQVDPAARAIGAVNTVIRRGKKLVGSNSDAPGALDAIERVVKVRGKKMLILGAGGAARAIAYEAKQRGAEVVISNRTARKGQDFAGEFGLGFVKWGKFAGVVFDILVNATLIGMVPDVNKTPVPKSILRNKIVFDAVYNPPITRLLREAKSQGAKIIQGTEMYINQAARQSELYTGRKPETSLMRQILGENKRSNIKDQKS